jgi:hypothetical protein
MADALDATNAAELASLRHSLGLRPGDPLSPAALAVVQEAARIMAAYWHAERAGSRVWRWPDGGE